MDPVQSACHVPSSIEQLENRLLLEVASKQKELLGNGKFSVSPDNTYHKELDRLITRIVKDFPLSQNGSMFIGSYCTIFPKLMVKMSKMEPIYRGIEEGGLFLDIVGKTICVGPLVHPILGCFTSTDTTLNLRNIRVLENCPLLPNEWTSQKLKNERVEAGTIAVNKRTATGVFNIDPKLKKTTLRADVELGAIFTQKNQEIAVETQGDERTTTYIISLPQLRAKISYLGVVVLQNGLKFSMDQLLGERPVRWINFEQSIVVPLTVQ